MAPGLLRILFIVWKLGGGGAERQLVNVARGLALRGHEVTVAVFYAGGEYEADLSDSHIRVVWLEKRGFWDILGFFRRIIGFTRELRPDVVHGYMDTGNFVATVVGLFVRRTRIVWGVRNSRLEWARYDPAGRILFHVNRIASRVPQLILANSRTAADDMARVGYPGNRIRVIYNGTDVKRFQPTASKAAATRASWAVPAEALVIGLAGRLDPMKDHATFVHAAQILASRRADVHFVCVGEGVEPHRSAALLLLDKAGLGDRLKWLGQMRDMPSFYSALDVLTSSSAFGESFSNVIAEGMACGVPCVVTDVGDSRAIVGETGLVIPPSDPVALAAAWEEMLGCLGPSLSAACRQRIERLFSVERLVEATEAALHEIGPTSVTGSRPTP